MNIIEYFLNKKEPFAIVCNYMKLKNKRISSIGYDYFIIVKKGCKSIPHDFCKSSDSRVLERNLTPIEMEYFKDNIGMFELVHHTTDGRVYNPKGVRNFKEFFPQAVNF